MYDEVENSTPHKEEIKRLSEENKWGNMEEIERLRHKIRVSNLRFEEHMKTLKDAESNIKKERERKEREAEELK